MNAVAEVSIVEIANRIVPDMPAYDYHAVRLGVASKSALDQIARSPAHYVAWCLTPRKPTPAMIFGSLTHLYVFEYPKFSESVVTMPDFNGKGSVAARQEWKDAHAGKTIVDQEDLDKIKAIGESVHKHPLAARLISQCKSEVSAFWIDPLTGLASKCRYDGLVESLRIGIDLKTTTDASDDGFAQSVANYRYHVQGAHYSNGYQEIAEKPLKGFVFVAVEKETPHAVATFDLLADESRAALVRGQELLERDMAIMKRCFEEDNWPAYGLNLKPITLKPWHLRD